MSSLADAVLPLIRTRGDVWRWDAADAQGDRMHDAIDILERELPSADPQEAYAVVHKALASAVKVIARADDSSGVIGGACQRLLDQVTEETRWTGPHAHEYGVLEWNERRLAVFDRNVDEIIRTHARGRKVAAMFDDTAHALEEIARSSSRSCGRGWPLSSIWDISRCEPRSTGASCSSLTIPMR